MKFVRLEGNNPMNEYWNDVVKAAVVEKRVLGTRNEFAKKKIQYIYIYI